MSAGSASGKRRDRRSRSLTAPAKVPGTWPAHVRARLAETVRAVGTCLRPATMKPEQVHRARRLLKEANALARLLADCDGVDARAVTREVVRLRRKLNDVRDIDVVEACLARFTPQIDPDLAGSIATALAARREALTTQGAQADAAEMRRDARRIGAEIVRWPLEETPPDALARAARRTYASLRRRGVAAFEKRAAHELHELRKPLIVHRYQIEAVERAWPRLFQAWAQEAQHLRDKLGEHHDLMMLADFAREAAGSAADPLLARIAEAQELLVDDAEPIFDRLCTEKPGAFERRLLACLSNAKKRIRHEASASAEAFPVAAKPQPEPVTQPAVKKARRTSALPETTSRA